jgi:DNA-binding XRE family transcriptional regulator/quercetin dioxygenase-like cupin family protein
MTADGPATSEPASPARRSVANLGGQLRRVRQRANLSAREVARQLDVSPSFVSQIETGRSQPSVATLYALAQLLEISIDELFASDTRVDAGADTRVDAGADAWADADHDPTMDGDDPVSGAGATTTHGSATRADGAARIADGAGPELHGHESGTRPDPARARISVVRRHDRAVLRLQSGVCWQQLAATSDHDLNFMEVVYPVGSASTTDATLLRHEGYEYHHVQQGVLEVTVNFEVHTLEPGDSMGFDSSLPHLLRNPGAVDTHCIVTVHRCAGA